MTPEKLKLLAEDIHPSNVYEIDDGEIWQVNLPKTDGSGSGRRTLAIQFNPVDCSDTREEVLLWLMRKGRWDFVYVPHHNHYCFSKQKEKSMSSDHYCNKDYTTALMMACEKELDNG